MHKYRLLSKKGEGTFSEVLKAQNILTGDYCAIKCMRTHFRNVDQVNALREVQALRRLNPHPNIIDLYEVLYDKQSGRLALVFELMHCNVYDLIRGRKQPLSSAKVKVIMYQLLKAVAHMHKHGIFHRDLKPENVLVAGDVIKVADLGSCRGIHTRQPYTEYISTRWYRAPECLLTAGQYDHRMDIWGVACLFYEVITLQPLFPGSNELDQLDRIHSIVGSPPLAVMQRLKAQSPHLKNLVVREYKGSGLAPLTAGMDPMAVELIEGMLAYDPVKRISAKQALRHPYFKEQREADKDLAASAKDLAASATAALSSTAGVPASPAPARVYATGGANTHPHPQPPLGLSKPLVDRTARRASQSLTSHAPAPAPSPAHAGSSGTHATSTSKALAHSLSTHSLLDSTHGKSSLGTQRLPLAAAAHASGAVTHTKTTAAAPTLRVGQPGGGARVPGGCVSGTCVSVCLCDVRNAARLKAAGQAAAKRRTKPTVALSATATASVAGGAGESGEREGRLRGSAELDEAVAALSSNRAAADKAGIGSSHSPNAGVGAGAGVPEDIEVEPGVFEQAPDAGKATQHRDPETSASGAANLGLALGLSNDTAQGMGSVKMLGTSNSVLSLAAQLRLSTTRSSAALLAAGNK